MSYTASPRPTFDGPTYIPYEAASRHLWGDKIAGEVSDWIYVSSSKIHQLVFGLPPGGWFRHSADYRTIFAADEIYYVLSGVLALNNPETGEVHRAVPGEAVFFRRDTWHHGYNLSSEPLRVLELFAPPPLRVRRVRMRAPNRCCRRPRPSRTNGWGAIRWSAHRWKRSSQ